MKAIKLAVVTLLFSIVLPLSYAHAGFFESYAEIYTVGSIGSTTQQTTFTTNQDPVLYIELYSTPPTDTSLFNESNTYTVTSPNSTVYNTSNSSSTNQFWSQYPSSVWNSIATTGTWTVSAQSTNNGSGSGGTSPIIFLAATDTPIFQGQTSFKVTACPEPVSTVLFLTGALIMGFSLIRRKKVLAV